MNGLFDVAAAEFSLQIMELLAGEEADPDNIGEVLTELCTYFDFTYGFVYRRNDYKNTFIGQTVASGGAASGVLPASLELNGADGEALLNCISAQKLISSIGAAARTGLQCQIGELLNLGTYILVPIIGENRQIIAMIGMGEANGRKRPEEVNLNAIYSIFVIVLNHMKVWHYAESIERTEQALESIANNMGVDIYVNDFDNHDVLYVNESMAKPYGGSARMLGKKCWNVLYEDKTGQCEYCPQKKLIDGDGRPTKIYSWDYQRPFDKAWFRVLSSAFRWEDGRMAHIVSSIDITEHKNQEELIRVIAEVDTLTGLPNRRKLFGDGEAMIARCVEAGTHFHALFFDLNKFKQVNDQYGHRAGDELLSQIGEFLRTNERTCGRSYRYGGDEFVLLLPEYTKEEVLMTAGELQRRFLEPWHLKSCDAVCHASIGVATYPFSDAKEVESPPHVRSAEIMERLLRAADESMYEAKRSGGGKIVFHNS